ncbi:3811_t:CDS:1, partial [Cetraspora pellucida]
QVGRPITMNPFTIAAQAKKRYYDKLTDSEDEATINITSSLMLNNNSENPQPKLSHLLRENLKFN